MDVHVDEITWKAGKEAVSTATTQMIRHSHWRPSDGIYKIIHIRSTSYTLGLQSDKERVQSCAMNIIYPNNPYIEALVNAQLTSVKERRVQLCEHFFTQIEHKLLPKARATTHNTRCRTRYSLPRVKTNRTKNCFINWCLFNQKNSQWLLTNIHACWYGYV